MKVYLLRPREYRVNYEVISADEVQENVVVYTENKIKPSAKVVQFSYTHVTNQRNGH